ncbi:neuropilin and tolloid-like protein 2-like protein, partial [Euroglyphus maynei]
TCRSDEFDCEDSTCIDIGLKCDGVDNCKYRYDEDKQTTCAPGNKGVLNLNSQHMVVILIVFCALVFGMCASIAISCWSKIEERSQRKREYKLRRSREASMEVGLDRTMTITSLDRTCPLEHGEQTSSSSGSRCRKIVTANAIRQKSDVVDDDEGPQMGYYDSEENGCYVPELDIAPMHHHSATSHHHLVYPSSTERRPKQMQTVQPNGGGTICTGHHLEPVDKYSPDTPTPPQMMIGSPRVGHIGGTQSPLVGDHYYHQQQQQLQQNIERDSIRSSSDCSIPPPPPPPSLSHFRNRLQQQPQQYRTLPLDPSKLTDASMLIMSDNHHQSIQYRHPQHTSRMIATGGGQPTMMIHPQHHPDCAQHQLNKMQQTSIDHQSQYNPNSLRRGATYYTNQPTSGCGGVQTQPTSCNSNPGSQRPSPMPIGNNGDTNELLNDVIDVDGCMDEGDESGVGPSEQRSAMELNDDIIDDDHQPVEDINHHQHNIIYYVCL